MKGRLLFSLLVAVLAPTLVVAEEGAGERAARPSLDLSLPQDALSETWSSPPAGRTSTLPDLGSPGVSAARIGAGGAGRRSDLPYGTGYEARQGGGGRGRGRGR